MFLPKRGSDDRNANLVNGSAAPAENPSLWTWWSHSCTATTLKAIQMAYAPDATTANFHVGTAVPVLFAFRQRPKALVFLKRRRRRCWFFMFPNKCRTRSLLARGRRRRLCRSAIKRFGAWQDFARSKTLAADHVD